MSYMAGHEPRILHEEIIEELQRARRKFPTREGLDNEDLLAMLAALGEEVGELCKDVIQFLYEPKKGKSYESIRAEAVQVAAMAMRVVLDTKLRDLNPYGHGQQ